MRSARASYIDYQARATAFHVGDRVYSVFGGNPSNGGTVVAVWPAIGMADVQFPHGSVRHPVEELMVDTSNRYDSTVDRAYDSVPGGVGTVPVAGGPYAQARRVASRALRSKRALYWKAQGRKYQATRDEVAAGRFCCPRCEESFLERTSYKMEEGKCVKLLVCRGCLFAVRTLDILYPKGYIP
jgi:hypothetical protein